MQTRWEAKVILYSVQLCALWLIVGLLIRPFNPEFVERVASGFYLVGLPNFPTLFVTIFVVILLSGLLRRQRIALVLYLIFFHAYKVLINALVLAFMAVLRFEDVTLSDIGWTVSPLLCSLFFLVIGVRAFPDFPARVMGKWKPALAVLLGGLLFDFMLLVTLFFAFYDFEMEQILQWSFYATLGMAPIDFSFDLGNDAPQTVLIIGEVIASLAIFLGVILLLRAVNAPTGTRDDQMLSRRMLLSPPSEDSLGYFATNDDRSIVLAPNGKAAVSFRVIDGVCIAAGDPLGEREFWPDAIHALERVARTNGWIFAAASISETGAKAYAHAGHRIIPLGDEAVIDTTRFDIKVLPSVRKVVAPLKRKGYSVRIQPQAQLTADERDALRTSAEQWRHGDERGFTMASGRVGDERDGRTVAVTAYSPDGEMVGLLTFVPWGKRGLSLDVMRRSPHAPTGLTELMVTELAKEGPGMNVDKFSLNFVMMREMMEKGSSVGAMWWQKLMLKLLIFSSRWWQIQSLYHSNVKYEPQWQARFLAVDHGLNTARMLLAYASGEGFLPRYSPPLPRLGEPEEIKALEDSLLHSSVGRRKLTIQQRLRREKLGQLNDHGVAAYPPHVPRTHSLIEVSGLAEDTGEVSVTGRVHHIRDHGGVVFADLEEQGCFHQVVVERSAGRALTCFRSLVSKGDLISVTGTVGRSRNGTASILASDWAMAAKSLVEFPSSPLVDPHARAQLRHMDLGTNLQHRDLVISRAKIIDAVRQTLRNQEFMEAETPILQTVHGGANARPFRTHIRAYDQNLTLRIAPELFLKRLIVGGVPKVFELGRNFRNEGVDATHNPEFTALEVYEAYGDWNSMRVLTEQLIRAAARAVHGSETLTFSNGTEIDLSKPWPVVPVYRAVSEATGVDIAPGDSVEQHADLAAHYGLNVSSIGELVNELYDELVEPNTVEPTFYSWFPVETSPLTMADPDEPLTAQRWDLVACGMELGTAYTELADPLEQRKRLTEQSLKAAGGDPEAMEVDENFLTALEFGMPPTGGLGIGMDRLVMFLLEQNIREVLAFPFIKPV